MRIRIAGRHGGRQREEGRRRETGSAARINGRADSARLRIAQIDGGRAQQAMDSAPEREGKRREEKVVSVSVSASESLEERREARGERRKRMQWSKATRGSQMAPESGRCVNER